MLLPTVVGKLLGVAAHLYSTNFPRHPVILSENDWGVQSPPQHSFRIPLPCSKGDWIPTKKKSLFKQGGDCTMEPLGGFEDF